MKFSRQSSGRQSSRRQYYRGAIHREAIFREAIVPGGNSPGGNLPGGNLMGGNSPGGNFPGGNSPCTFSKYLKHIFNKITNRGKKIFVIGDLNINCLSYGSNSETKSFFDNIFQLGVIPIINKPTRITPTSITAIDNILTNSFFDLTLKTGIIKTDISDHFPIYFSTKTETSYENVPSGKYYKRIINDTTINNFKEKLSNLNWDHVINELNADSAYNKFITTFVHGL